MIIMSGHEKLLKRFLRRPKDFTYDELESLLASFGYSTVRTGRTAGSRVAFVHEDTKHIIRLHKPHPKNIMRTYQMADIERELRSKGLLP